ncbi:hypothetical protein [Aquimarina sp. RZ0]|uniref:hypothetical protein n=1 Tax=Aquimarina sp. RZ0 TaxID=2607730 RepID=UPI0011F34CE1|nr:hypothetical protein [Aquimarina sp. RZ0]KAA1247599.1 hypothetical protein F0000_01980 [Aquimarina sp. RZ0]
MDVLKKIRAATLIETLTASVLIIIVFMIASFSFNNIFTNHIKRDQTTIKNRVKELEYLLIHQKIKLPYTEDFGNWEIEIISETPTIVLRYRQGTNEYEKQVVLRE